MRFHFFDSLGDHHQGTSWHSSNIIKTTPKKTEKVHIFYNLFTKSSHDEKRVIRIVEQQLALVDPALHEPNVLITSIGHRLPLEDASLGNASYHVSQHHDEGNEYLTLHRLWEFCKSNQHNDAKVVYLHSKGSHHPNLRNDKLRNFLTQGALSSECANLPQSCNVCSSRMSPLPHPHTPGNMWLARCDYVSKLINPFLPKEGKLADALFSDDIGCKGRGRYFSEHWIHSHPSVRPCDLYTGKEYLWHYYNVPAELSEKDLQIAPRFKFHDYIINNECQDESYHFVVTREEQYKLLYNITRLSANWWGWIFLEKG